MEASATPHDILTFWREAGPGRWFTPDDEFDELCRRRYLPAHEQAAAGALGAWEGTPEGALALVLLLDQMPRNMFRGDPRTYATDRAAVLTLAGQCAQALERARLYARRALDSLAAFPSGKAKAAMSEAVEFAVARAY